MYKLRSDAADYVIRNKGGNPAQRRNDERKDRSNHERIVRVIPDREQNAMLYQKRENDMTAPRRPVARTWEGNAGRPASFEGESNDSEDDAQWRIINARQEDQDSHQLAQGKTASSKLPRIKARRSSTYSPRRRSGVNSWDGSRTVDHFTEESDDSEDIYTVRTTMPRGERAQMGTRKESAIERLRSISPTRFQKARPAYVEESYSESYTDSGSDSLDEDDNKFSGTARDEFRGAYIHKVTNLDSTVSSTISQDKTSGEGARNAEMLADFGQKCLRFPGAQEETLNATGPPYSRFPNVRDRSESPRGTRPLIYNARHSPKVRRHQAYYQSRYDDEPPVRYVERGRDASRDPGEGATPQSFGEVKIAQRYTPADVVYGDYYRPQNDPKFKTPSREFNYKPKIINSEDAERDGNLAPNAQMLLANGINGNLTAQQFQNFPGQAQGESKAVPRDFYYNIAQQQQQSRRPYRY
ncbi:hypothetical protein V494_08334 [Pseudogymnoascus sp. VKM F-4513 (FW-928)]|nr:hypothetical protein V494_08334 [Pseudogymnoascus sp. VKM F-4513 (FW-928)]